MALHCRKEVWQLRVSRDQALHFLPGARPQCAPVQGWVAAIAGSCSAVQAAGDSTALLGRCCVRHEKKKNSYLFLFPKSAPSLIQMLCLRVFLKSVPAQREPWRAGRGRCARSLSAGPALGPLFHVVIATSAGARHARGSSALRPVANERAEWWRRWPMGSGGGGASGSPGRLKR